MHGHSAFREGSTHTHTSVGAKRVYTHLDLFFVPHKSRAAVQWLFPEEGGRSPLIRDGGGVAVDEEESRDEMRADDEAGVKDDAGDATTVDDVLGAGLG